MEYKMPTESQDIIKNPYYDTLKAICREDPPEFCKGIFNSKELDDDQYTELQDWCCLNRNLDWATGIGYIEAVDHIVECAVENGNIHERNSQ